MPLRAYSNADETKPVVWIGSAKDDLVTFPEEVVRAIGFALYEAQKGNKHPSAKPLHGFGGAGVLEIVEDHDGDTQGDSVLRPPSELTIANQSL